MANTYSRIYIQIVFTVQGRQNLLPVQHKEELHRYIAGIIRSLNQKLIIINSMPDHVHILVGLKPDMAISDLVEKIKSNSSRFINSKKWVLGKFNWQKGYGAFSYGHSQLQNIINYIKNQEVHHKRRTFQDEYIEFLKKFEIDYDAKYLFKWVDTD
jgi:REP element-mobilizing transposase RayT